MQPWQTTFGRLLAVILRFTDQLPFFRFAKILYISDEFENVHVQWFEHSTKTAMEQLGHPQELFLTNICSTVEFDVIIGKVSVQFVDPSKEMPVIAPFNYFYKLYIFHNVKDFADMSACRFIYSSLDGSFTEIPQDRLQRGLGQHPYDHCPCPVCLMVEEQEDALVPHEIYRGAAWKGAKYHLRDFVMIKAREGPCHIGQITRVHIQQPDDEGWVRVRMFGRISELGLRPVEELKDEVRAHAHARSSL